MPKTLQRLFLALEFLLNRCCFALRRFLVKSEGYVQLECVGFSRVQSDVLTSLYRIFIYKLCPIGKKIPFSFLVSFHKFGYRVEDEKSICIFSYDLLFNFKISRIFKISFLVRLNQL